MGACNALLLKVNQPLGAAHKNGEGSSSSSPRRVEDRVHHGGYRGGQHVHGRRLGRHGHGLKGRSKEARLREPEMGPKNECRGLPPLGRNGGAIADPSLLLRFAAKPLLQDSFIADLVVGLRI